MTLPFSHFPVVAESVKVIDGDTIRCAADLGFRVFHQVTVRLDGIDAPELRTEAGRTVKLMVERWFRELGSRALAGSTFVLASHELDKYGRSLGTFTCPAVKGKNPPLQTLNDVLIDIGCRGYSGKKREAWTLEELAEIQKSATARGWA